MTGNVNSISGIVAGPTVQAGAVHGGVHIHTGDRPPAPVPRQLPPPPARFAGRETELSRLDAAMGDGRSPGVPLVVVLTGPGGIGKTALALHWLHRTDAAFPDGQLYVDLAGFSGTEPLDPGETLGRFIRALGVPAQHVPAELSEQASLFRSLTAGKSLAMVLDNAYSVGQARVLLPASNRALVVITSRSRLTGFDADGVSRLMIGPLDEGAAVRLLDGAVEAGRTAREPDESTALVRLCGGLPLAVRLAAARLAARPRWPVRRLLTELHDERYRLDTLDGGGEGSLRALFDLSYEQLTDAAARLYRRLSLHPGRTFDSGVCTAVLHEAPSEAEDRLYELVDLTLVEEIGSDRFRLHDLLRLHASRCAGTDEAPSERDDVERRIAQWYLAAASVADHVVTPYRRRIPYQHTGSAEALPSFAHREDALAWLEAERENLLSAGRLSLERGWPELAWQLSDVMWPLLLYRKHYRDRMVIDERGVRAAQAWGNPVAEADMRKRLGLALRTAGRHEEAEAQLRTSLAQWRELGDLAGCAEAEEALGILYMSTGRWSEAIEQLEAALARHRTTGNRRAAGLALVNLASSLPEVGRPGPAMRCILEAKSIFDELADQDPYNRARVLVVLARLRCRADEVSDAEDLANTALDEMHSLGSEFGAAEAREVLAETALRRGDPDAAREQLDLADETFTALRSPRAGVLRIRLGPCLRAARGAEVRGGDDRDDAGTAHGPAEGEDQAARNDDSGH